MATVRLLQATPLLAAGTTTQTVNLAGGGSSGRPYYDYLGIKNWRSGIIAQPRFKAALGFDASGFNGGFIPQTAQVDFGSADRALLDTLSGLFWDKAPVTLSSGDDAFGTPSFATDFVGSVADISYSRGIISLTMADRTGDLDIPIAKDTFGGTGGIDGVAEAAGRLKRRSLGWVFDVEGKVLDKANNIFEFGDPARSFDSMTAIRDMGKEGPRGVDIVWQGSIAATFAALQAASVPSGGATAAPSIACAKWWTAPNGPLTADIKGENAGGYVETPADIAARLASFVGITITNVAAINAIKPWSAGLHFDSESETISNALDRLLYPTTLLWVVNPAGTITIRRQQFASPVETLLIRDTRRRKLLPPLRKRTLGYKKNHRVHSSSEISASLLAGDLSGAVDFATQVAGAAKPENNADVTGTHQASTIAGQGPGATDQRSPDLIYKAKQNTLVNGGFNLGFAYWSNGSGFTWTKDFRGQVVGPPPGTGGTFVVANVEPINVPNGQAMTLAATMFGSAGTALQGMFVDIQWNNGGDGALVGYSSGLTGNGVSWVGGGSWFNDRRAQPMNAPNATDGSGFVRGYARVVSFSDIAATLNVRSVSNVKMEIASDPTPFSDEATDAAILGRSIGTLNDGRNLNVSNNYGLRALGAYPTFTFTDTGSSITIDLSSSTFYGDWGGSVSLPSVTIPGNAYATPYYVYRNQATVTTAGTSYSITTNFPDAVGTGKNYVGYAQTPNFGGGGGSSGGGGRPDCVKADSLVRTRRGDILAREVVAGDEVLALTVERDGVEWVPVDSNAVGENMVVRITTFDGVALTLALNTWLTCRDGTLILAANAHWVDVPVVTEDGKLDWRQCTVEGLPDLVEVAHIKCGSRTYAAGDEPGAMILTHNIDKP